ncbi:MAG: HD domain-containing protein [Prevotella sp.]|nr:HD domain-containing protein [Prevotella sp.]
MDWVMGIIDKYYPDDNELRRILLTHSRDVAARALQICDRHPELHLDRQFVEEAAMLHDIGIFLCDAPGIACRGSEHYLRHGILGADLLRKEGYPRHARVCERHTGAGLTKESIISEGLPLPPEDFLPETLEEKVVCYADIFYGKSNLKKVKTIEKAERSIARFGEDGLARFKEWVAMFE